VEIMVRLDEIRIGDMVLYGGGWHVVKRLSPVTGDVQIITSDDRTEWVPVAELGGIERRPVR
jgi:hypothetical protein